MIVHASRVETVSGVSQVASTQTTGPNGECSSLLPENIRSIISSLNSSVTLSKFNNQVLPKMRLETGADQKVTIVFVNTFIVYVKIRRYLMGSFLIAHMEVKYSSLYYLL